MLSMDDRTLRRAIDRGELPAEPGPTKNSPRRISRGDVQRYAAERGIPLQVNGKSIDATTGAVMPEADPGWTVCPACGRGQDTPSCSAREHWGVAAKPAVAEVPAEKPARRAPATSSSSEWIERAVRAETRLETLRELISAQSNPETIAMLQLLVAAWEVEA